MSVPSAVPQLCTSNALPLLRLISRLVPSASGSIRQRWFAPPWQVHWVTFATSAVDQSRTSRHLPVARLTSLTALGV